MAPYLRARWRTIGWPLTAPALRSRRIGAAALGRPVRWNVDSPGRTIHIDRA